MWIFWLSWDHEIEDADSVLPDTSAGAEIFVDWLAADVSQLTRQNY
jgi:hypothetical protein